MPADPEATDPAARAPRRRISDLDLPTAGALEVGRGVLTSGSAVLVLWQLISGQLGDMRDDIRAVGADVAQVRGALTSLQMDVARLQARQDMAAPPAR